MIHIKEGKRKWRGKKKQREQTKYKMKNLRPNISIIILNINVLDNQSKDSTGRIN